MSLFDDRIFGLTIDENDDTGISQEDLSEVILASYERNQLLRLCDKRVTPSLVKYYINEIDNEDEIFWEKMLRRLVNVYFLFNLRLFLTEIRISSFEEHVIDFVKDIKINIPQDIVERKITKDTTRDELEDLLMGDKKYKTFLKWSIKFIDRESYERFLKQIIKISKMTFYSEEDDEEY